MSDKVNSVDATRGQPLVVRARTRKAELEQALKKLPADATRERAEIEVVLKSFDSLLTGEVSGPTAQTLSRVLENSKHLAQGITGK
jgi:hypothetical protein